MSKKKSIRNLEELSKLNVIFCTECGEELEMFGIKKENIDLEKIKERFQHCKESGKFKGDKCAMIFIAESNENLFNDE